jgi:arabinose-5-phosphate isomerase
MGDALAVAVLKRRGLTPEDYAQFHPAGSLGARLLLRVQDIMRKGDEIARVQRGTPVREAILEMTQKKVGATCVVEADGTLAGILTDHDLRKILARDGVDLAKVPVDQSMTANPTFVRPDMLVAEAVRVTETRSISVLPVLDPGRRLVGIVHLHDLLRSGAA